jgi:hypothetical protein
LAGHNLIETGGQNIRFGASHLLSLRRLKTLLWRPC